MSKSIITPGVTVGFWTPGLIPIESFTTFGMHAKPNTDTAIGYFGTGLKYAIAVLLREGCEVVVVRGFVKYVFYLKKHKFRDQEYDTVRMRKSSATGRLTYHRLPFTTQLGKDWELWQAFREIESNTRDEQGHSVVMRTLQDEMHLTEETVIYITSPKFADVYERRDEVFLPEGDMDTVTELRASGATIQIIHRESKYLYYRGLRVYELPKPSYYTYNLIRNTTLTEDRTLAYAALANDYMCRDFVPIATDKEAQAIVNVKEKYWEHDWPYDSPYTDILPNDAVRQAMIQRRRRRTPLPPRMSSYYDSSIRQTPVIQPESLLDRWRKFEDDSRLIAVPGLTSLVRDTITHLDPDSILF